jgi:hypothetical protein
MTGDSRFALGNLVLVGIARLGIMLYIIDS